MTAPVLACTGHGDAAGLLYRLEHIGCSQVPSHSLTVCNRPMGLCARHMALYSSIAIFGLVASISPVKSWRPRSPLAIVFMIASFAPMALDVGMSWVSAWSPNTVSRLLTGAVAGAGVMVCLLAATTAQVGDLPVLLVTGGGSVPCWGPEEGGALP